jgi:type IV pilus biogenesis protein CpaD/CtpE
LVNDENYRFGCTLDTVVARQVRPKDLAGRGGDDVMNDGRRNANIVERYRTGEPNKALEGESASK